MTRVKNGVIKEVWIIIQALAEDYNPNRNRKTGRYESGAKQEAESSAVINSAVQLQEEKPKKRLARTFTTTKDIFLKNSGYKIPKGSVLRGIKAIAYGHQIRQLRMLNRKYRPKGSIDDWVKVRCTTEVEFKGIKGTREVHYYFHPDCGGVEWKFPSNKKQTGVPRKGSTK